MAKEVDNIDIDKDTKINLNIKTSDSSFTTNFSVCNQKTGASIKVQNLRNEPKAVNVFQSIMQYQEIEIQKETNQIQEEANKIQTKMIEAQKKQIAG